MASSICSNIGLISLKTPYSKDTRHNIAAVGGWVLSFAFVGDRLEPRQVESVSSSPVPCFPTVFIIYIDSLHECCLSGGYPLSPMAARAKTNGCSVAVVPGVAPHHRTPSTLSTTLYLLFHSSCPPLILLKMTSSINSWGVK